MAKNEQSNKQPFIEHVQELRQRLFIWALSALAGGVVGYFLSDRIQELLIKPLNQPLFYTSPTGGFDFLLRICIFFGILVSIPIMTYQLLKFIEPTLANKTRFLIIKLLLSSVTLAAVGVSFAYFVSLPAALHFLMDFGNSNIKSLISTDAYMSFVMLYLAGYALLFQLPLILLFINRVKPMKPKKLMGAQRYVILGSFVVSAMLTPTPDPINQGIMAGPMIALYELSIIVIWLINRRPRKDAEEVLAPVVSLEELKQAAAAPTRTDRRPLDAPLVRERRAAMPALPASALLRSSTGNSQHLLKLDPKPFIQPRPQPVANTVPSSVWRQPSVVALADKPIPQRPAQAPPPTHSQPGRPAPVDLAAMNKRDPFYRPSRNVIDMRPKPNSQAS